MQLSEEQLEALKRNICFKIASKCDEWKENKIDASELIHNIKNYIIMYTIERER